MKEYIKKFETAVSAHGYVIADIPFTTSVNEIPIQNLVCNKTGKWLENDNGIVIICPPDIPNDEIHYTAASQVTPNDTTIFGANYLPDESEFNETTSKGILKFDGDVTNIGSNAFWFRTSLTSIEIPNSVTIIGNSAFESCSGLTSIEIPNSVTSIGDSAFSGCSNLASIEIPNSVISIGTQVFANCRNLTSITIPDSIEDIGQSAFNGCSGLTSIIVDNDNTVYDSRNNCNAIIETTTNTLIRGCQNTIIPDSVTNIYNSAFTSCTNLTSITIPNSVTRINDYAFNWCSGLTSITCERTTPPTIYTNTWKNVTKSIPIYVPADSVSLYQQAQYWSQFTNIQQIP